MIAFHFPPMAGSSGIQRTLRLVQQLPALGWQPLVLTVHPRAYERTSIDLLDDIPPGTLVRQAFALDTTRHLAVAGRYLASWARPDRWVSWQWDAVRQGLRMIDEFKPEALWSTFPIATAHRVGAELQRRSGLPWLADFRDPMAQEGYPADPKTWRQFERIEAEAAARAALCCFTTPSALETYQRRYPSSASRMRLLENGYDEASFAKVEAARGKFMPLNPGYFTILHSGIVYPSERDPTQLFEALGALRRNHADIAARLKIRFRAALSEELLHGLARRHGVQAMVEILPPIAYGSALAEMLDADGLLLMQDLNCNEQIPAKVYEYLRAKRPIMCLSDAAGDSWRLLRGAGVESMAHLNRASEIAALLLRFIAGPQEPWLPRPQAVAAASREARSIDLAAHLDQAVSKAALQ